MASKNYFGTDGIRGTVGDTVINAKFMLQLGSVVGSVLARSGGKKAIIGRDTRESGLMIESALVAGLLSSGMDVCLLGVMPTPAVAHLTPFLNADVGIVISASHNPFYDNGVKFFNAEGFKLNDEIELLIERELLEGGIKTSEKIGKVERVSVPGDYYDEFCKKTLPDTFHLRHKKIVLDCAEGATFLIGPHIFSQHGATMTCIHNNPNGRNINEKCGATDVESLRQKVLEIGADVGIAFDGDGDRVIMVDHEGGVVDGDELLFILAEEKMKDPKAARGVVGTLMSNLGLEKALDAKNIEFCRAKVGDRYVLQEMLKRDWKLGGENSGHIIDLDYATTGDGILAALHVLNVMMQTSQSLHELKKGMQKYPQVLINVPIGHSGDVTQYPKIQNAVSEAERSLNHDGRVLLRASGTEPLIRVMVEGSDAIKVQKLAENLAITVKQEMRE
jgi:phosphoglucosamine mutase